MKIRRTTHRPKPGRTASFSNTMDHLRIAHHCLEYFFHNWFKRGPKPVKQLHFNILNLTGWRIAYNNIH